MQLLRRDVAHDAVAVASCSGGGVSSQMAPILRGQRPLNGQPRGISVALGSGPSRTMRAPWASGSGTGTAESSASVYG